MSQFKPSMKPVALFRQLFYCSRGKHRKVPIVESGSHRLKCRDCTMTHLNCAELSDLLSLATKK